ncbi:MAG: membrane protein insertase YidC [endosymbiont of Galathealinum brachiosum]|uniref:Membrane protein insertase YidC n=1 Tax=endosymbiont of Galathealinum brachiosum TaxID=2200906 RepID=A0A370DCR8_9GAMM|nr:MAG: membrane protein insertase YidC [endosymbiont of Galathealinum brachiosum]
MENQRTILYLAFFFTLFLLYQEWQKSYGPQPVVTDIENAASSVPGADADLSSLPQAVIPTGTKSINASPLASEENVSRNAVHVVTDVMDLMIDTQGGTIYQLDLRDYQLSAEQIDKPFRLFSTKESLYHTAQSGLVSSAHPAPNHKDIYQAERTEYRLEEGTDELKVTLYWQKEGVTVNKIFTFTRDSYVIDVEHVVSAQNWNGSEYRQLVRSLQERESTMIPTYVGGVVFNEEIKYEKVDFDDIEEQSFKTDMKGGWIAMIQHYFMSAWVPDQKQENFTYTSHPTGNRYILGMRSPAVNATAQSPAVFNSQLVVGPKLQGKLEEISPGLELVVDYGILTILAKPLFWLLEFYHSQFNNWGWAIIFLTITVKAAFYWLSAKGYRSMARMRKVGPRMQQLKERYGDDRQRMSAEMMKMYKEEKINPLGGCFPILIQIPVFIALYWVLLESVEMRNAPFALWIQNLSEQDPYFILPILMGATMYIQQKLNPAPVDPVQQKVFQFMPLVFTIFFLFFPAGLVLYWVVNNTLSIIQQWIITRNIESEK